MHDQVSKWLLIKNLTFSQNNNIADDIYHDSRLRGWRVRIISDSPTVC